MRGLTSFWSRRRAPLSLRQTLLLGAGLGILLPALVLAYFQITTQFERDVELRVRAPLQQYADVLTRGLSVAIWTVDKLATAELVDAVMGNPDVVSIVVTNEFDDVIAQKARPPARGAELLSEARDIVYNNTRVGRVVVELSMDRVRQAFWHDLVKQGLALVAQFAISFVLMGLLFERRMVRPLYALTRATQRIARGEPSQPLQWQRQDEIGELAQGLDTMQAELAALTAEREQKNAALQESEERYRLLFDTSLDAIILTNQEGGVQSANRAACRLLDRTEDEIRQLGRSGLMDMHDPRLAKALDERAKTGKFFGELTMIRRDGSPFPVEISSTQFRASDGTLRSSLIIRDISERQQVEQNLRIAATAFESQEGMTVADAQGVVLRVNKAFTEITGYSESDMVGQTHRILHSGQQDPAFYVAMWDSITRTGAWQGEIWNRRKSGEAFPVFLSVTAVKGEDGSVTHYVGAFTDITQRKVAEDEITQLAFYDQLTRLPNRRLMLDRLQQALTISARRECHGALMMVDLDNFKSLNDTFGHAAGDLLLVEVAARLKSTIREGDTVARLGGDEFVVILKDLESSGDQAAVQAQVVANSIQTRLAQPYWLEVSTDGAAPDLRSHHCTSSTGVALFFDQSVTVDELMKRADTAMYQAKAVGRNTLCFFDPQMQAVVKARATLELDLHKAVESGQFVLHYQPQLASSGRVIGAEALVRWQHPQRGLVAPGEFIPLAEETGLILPLGYWVLESACTQLAVWATQPALAHLDLAVNVSACQFGVVDFVAQVKTVLARTQAPAHRLKLELTESLLLDNTSVIVTRMAELKTLGVSFSIDDFGTGYSSLAYLKRLPLDQLKIDQSFVRDILTDPNDAAIAKTIIALAQTMGMSVIAEGVETVQQRDFLTTCGCLTYQGYLFSRPLPLEAFEVFVHRENGQA